MDNYDYWKTTPPQSLEEMLEEEMEAATKADWIYDMDKHDG